MSNRGTTTPRAAHAEPGRVETAGPTAAAWSCPDCTYTVSGAEVERVRAAADLHSRLTCPARRGRR
jgi:hypothetical protein